jgi:hypothetical protein
MDQVCLAKAAEALEKILLQYAAVDPEVSHLFDALSKLIDDARTGKFLDPIEWRDIPGAHSFTKGGLRKYASLETAYARFKIEATGGESPVLKRLRLNAATKP